MTGTSVDDLSCACRHPDHRGKVCGWTMTGPAALCDICRTSGHGHHESDQVDALRYATEHLLHSHTCSICGQPWDPTVPHLCGPPVTRGRIAYEQGRLAEIDPDDVHRRRDHDVTGAGALKLTVMWRRSSEPDRVLVCTGLTPTTALRRLRRAIRTSGPVVVDSVVIERAAGPDDEVDRLARRGG